MELAGDLTTEALTRALPGRPLRAYPALLSTEADATAWARAGAEHGAVVVADYQASARGRGGWPWQVQAGRDLGFSIVVRPRLTPEREGWLYTVAALGIGDALGDEADVSIEWPDRVSAGGSLSASIAVRAELDATGVAWAVISVLVPGPGAPRAPLLGLLAEGIEARGRLDPPTALADYQPRCVTLGRRVRTRLIPLGPGGVEVTGRAARTLQDGALVIATDEDRRVAVRPQSLGTLEYLDQVQD